MLPARAAGPVGVNAQVLIAHLHIHLAAHERATCQVAVRLWLGHTGSARSYVQMSAWWFIRPPMRLPDGVATHLMAMHEYRKHAEPPLGPAEVSHRVHKYTQNLDHSLDNLGYIVSSLVEK